MGVAGAAHGLLYRGNTTFPMPRDCRIEKRFFPKILVVSKRFLNFALCYYLKLDMVNLNKIMEQTGLNNVNAAQIVLQRFVSSIFLYNTHTHTHTHILFSSLERFLDHIHAARAHIRHFLQYSKRCFCVLPCFKTKTRDR